jgi:hypothetical protein
MSARDVANGLIVLDADDGREQGDLAVLDDLELSNDERQMLVEAAADPLEVRRSLAAKYVTDHRDELSDDETRSIQEWATYAYMRKMLHDHAPAVQAMDDDPALGDRVLEGIFSGLPEPEPDEATKAFLTIMATIQADSEVSGYKKGLDPFNLPPGYGAGAPGTLCNPWKLDYVYLGNLAQPVYDPTPPPPTKT